MATIPLPSWFSIDISKVPVHVTPVSTPIRDPVLPLSPPSPVRDTVIALQEAAGIDRHEAARWT
jgi:hypothetical protein